MENLTISQKETSLHIEGFPEAVKVIAINGPIAKRLADLSLHKADLDFANSCLDSINLAPVEPYIIREALWRSAVVHFQKCFGNSARFQLSAEKIYKAEPPEALLVFDFFKNLRNKHFVHDENSYAQSIPGAILNDGTKDYKIEKVICFSAVGTTLEQQSFGSLKLLIEKALIWVTAEFDHLCGTITIELEKESYQALAAREGITYQVPRAEEISQTRKSPESPLIP